MKYEYYTQMPGTLTTGTDIVTINPDPTTGNLTRLKSVYIDLPTGVTLNINLSALGPKQNDIVSNGNEAGSIIFRSGVMITTPITVTVTGPTSTPYGVKVITEIETPTATAAVAQAGFSGAQLLLVAGLAVGFVYMTMKQKEKETIPTIHPIHPTVHPIH